MLVCYILVVLRIACYGIMCTIPSVPARFAQGYLKELIDTLLSFAAPSKQFINALLRLLRKHAAIDIRFVHDIAQAVDKLINSLRMHFAQVAMQ